MTTTTPTATLTPLQISNETTQVSIALATVTCMRRSGETKAVLARRDERVAALEARLAELKRLAAQIDIDDEAAREDAGEDV